MTGRPVCATPGCDRPGVELDHILPKADGGADIGSNRQWLCVPCHWRKTTGENRLRSKYKHGQPMRPEYTGQPAKQGALL